jgi:ribosomal protein S18 acetylase RimI-like enzyme
VNSMGQVRVLGMESLGLIAAIDRSEHVDIEYQVVNGQLQPRPVTMADIPPWDAAGTGPYSVAARMGFCRDLVAAGAVLIGCFYADACAGLAVVDPSFGPGLAWLAFLHVSQPYRRQGVASALWDRSARIAAEAGNESMYVSATPTGSAVGFYLGQGCQLADPVHPVLYAKEPDDIHLVCPLTPGHATGG